MKERFVKILAFLLLLAVAIEPGSLMWQHSDVSVVFAEKEEKGNAKETEMLKEESKDKIAQWQNLQVGSNADCELRVLKYIHFSYSAYLSLPEIPPELV